MPRNGYVGIRASPCKKVAVSLAQLKGTYTNALSMGNKLEHLEAILQQEGYDTAATTETWWDGSCEWNTAIDG